MSWRLAGIAAGTVALAGILGAALLMAINLARYEHAAVCGSDSSRNCIHQSTGTITAPGREVDSSWCGTGPAGACHDRTDHSIVVTPRGSVRQVELWDTREHADFVVGDTVKLERWQGRYIAVSDRGHRVEVDDWHPRLLETLLIVASASAVVITLMWRFKLMTLNEKAEGIKGKIKLTLGVLVGIYGSVLVIFLFWVAVPASAPLLYLR